MPLCALCGWTRLRSPTYAVFRLCHTDGNMEENVVLPLVLSLPTKERSKLGLLLMLIALLVVFGRVIFGPLKITVVA